jgi:hypothetical protein
MALIEPDVIFRRLAQIIRIRPIVYHGVMVVIASRIIGSPSDNGDVVMGNFERWPFDDLDMLGPRRRRRILSGDGAAKEQAARYRDGCPYHEAPTHQTDPLWLPWTVA